MLNILWRLDMKKCINCDAEITSKYGKLFCSKSCSAKHGNQVRNDSGWEMSDDAKKKISEKLIGNSNSDGLAGKRKVAYKQLSCVSCQIQFEVRIRSNQKYCGITCAKKHAGGYREGSGRAKSGYYKGIYCGSTYELVWVIYQLDHNLKFSRFSGTLQKDDLTYIPDFIIDNTIIEIKGFEHQDLVEAKTKLAQSFGYAVVVLRKEQLQTEFDWVKTNYIYKEVYELYDNYQPAYTLTCSCCGISFNRNKKSRTDSVFCSRKCSGMSRIGKGNPTGINGSTKPREAAGVADSPSNY